LTGVNKFDKIIASSYSKSSN